MSLVDDNDFKVLRDTVFELHKRVQDRQKWEAFTQNWYFRKAGE